MVNAILCSLVYQGNTSVFNIGSGKGLSLRELIQAIQYEVGYTLNVDYHDFRKFDVPTNVLKIDQAIKYLNWAPRVSIEEGLRVFHNYLTRI